jgi:signal transduction histidine kinase
MSLRLKMTLGIGAILVLVVLVYAIIASSSRTNYLLSIARHEADLVAALADRALSNAMEEGEQQVVQAILRRLGQHPDVVGIRIMDAKGITRYSTRPADLGQILMPKELPIEGGGLEPVWDFHEQTVGVFRPVPNGPTCTRCHPKRQEILGFLNVQVAFPVIEGETRQQWTVMIFAGIAGLFASAGLIWLLFTLVVGRRLDALVQAMNRVEAGDLTAQAVADDQDELGRLGATFNTMVAHLADARRQLQDQHAEQIRRAENLASLGKMAAGIAHEINNPIAGMLNCVRSLVKGLKDERQRLQYLEMLQEGLSRIGRTVGQLLDFAREAKPQLTRTDLRALLSHCLDLLEQDLAARQITCSPFRDGSVPAILADPYQLEQVFLNILKNAMDAMPEGGTIVVSASVQEREASSFLEVQIADTGIGIPSENLSRIFDPFFTTKEVGKGTGLGLSVSYGIVRAHGGYIEVKSEIGKGSRFTVGLPVREG